MNIELVDAELAVHLKSFPALDIWTDLAKTRQLGAQMRAKIIGELPKIEGVESADYLIPQADAPEVLVRVYRPENQLEPIAGTAVDSWWRLLLGRDGKR